MKRKKSKLGVVSHVGVVLSFIIFITFIFFIYIIIRPVVSVKDQENLLDYIEGVIIENASANMLSASVSMVDSSNTCINLIGFLDGLDIGNNIVVRNKDGNALSSKISDQNLYVRKDAEDIFLKISGADAFDITETGAMDACQQANEGFPGYWFGFVTIEKNIFEGRIVKIIEDYNSNYEDLKEELNIPSGKDFGLSFTYANQTIIETEEKSTSGNIFIRKTSIEYINKNASREAGYLNTKMWG